MATPPHNPEPGPAAGPVVVRVANCQSVNARRVKSAGIFHTAMTKRGEFGRPDVVLACECSDFKAPRLAAEVGWEAVQFGIVPGAINVAQAGSVVAWNPKVARQTGEARLIVGSDAGEGIRTRYVAQVPLAAGGHDEEPFNAGHAPPDRAPNRQRQFLDRAADLLGVVGCDWNTWPKTLRRLFAGWKVRGVHVLSLLVPKRIPCSKAAAVDIGGDHLAVDVVLWPTKKEKNR